MKSLVFQAVIPLAALLLGLSNTSNGFPAEESPADFLHARASLLAPTLALVKRNGSEDGLEPFTFKKKTYQTRWLYGANGGSYLHEKPERKKWGITKPAKKQVFKQGVDEQEKNFLKETGRLKGSEPDPNMASAFRVKMRFEEGKPLMQTDAYQTIMRGGKAACEAWMALIRQAARNEHSRMANSYNIIQVNGNVRNFLWRDVSTPTATDPGVRAKMVDLGGARRRTPQDNLAAIQAPGGEAGTSIETAFSNAMCAQLPPP